MTPESSTRDPALILKSTPPRAVRGFLDRERLRLDRLELSGASVTALLAPTGFGKTAQLTHWRKEALSSGALAFWYSADSRDEPQRFALGLAYSARVGCGKRGFADPFMKWMAACVDPQEAVTGWLAEVAELSVEVLLLLDDVEQLPASSRSQVLSYLLGNAPPNLRIAFAARGSSALVASGALSPAAVTRVTAIDLRFRPDETVAVFSGALGRRSNPETCVHLHELSEGWPLGVQLAVGALHKGGDMEGLLAAATSDIQHFFVDAVIDRQPPDATQLLVRLAQFNLIHPQLCAAALGDERFADELLRLQNDTPLLLRAEGENWMRLHPLAREVLQRRLAQLPSSERAALALKASAWYADRDLYEEAAEQAFLAGEVAQSISLVEKSAGQMTVQGRSTALLAWYRRLSPNQLQERPSFWAPAAWALAMSDRNAEAQPLIELIAAKAQGNTSQLFEATLLGVTAASFSDRIDLTGRLLDEWPSPPPDARPDIVPIHAVARANWVLYQGQPEQARLLLTHIGRLDRAQAYSPVSYGFSACITGMSYLWEGRAALAEQVLRPALVRAEERMDRYHPVACMLAAMMAQACWETGMDEHASALLAGRMDILERYGLPETLMAAQKTLARTADDEGHQDRALSMLEALRAIGQSRGMTRIQVMAQYEMVRLHAKHDRVDTARSLSAQLEALIRIRSTGLSSSVSAWMDLHAEMARAHSLLSAGNNESLPQAQQAIEAAIGLATSLKRTGDIVEMRLLQSEALRRGGAANADNLRAEALSLAHAEGMQRVLRELGDRRDPQPLAPVEKPDAQREIQVRAAGLLTAKEHEVLTLLHRNLSNKEIALAMSIGEQTIKWHVKNLFNKLNAANRKHAVARARLLGLVDG